MNIEDRTPRKTYANYMQYAVQYKEANKSFDCIYAGKGVFIRNARLTLFGHDKEKCCTDSVTTEWEQRNYHGDTRLTLNCKGEAEASLYFVVSKNGIEINVECEPQYTPVISGDFVWGDKENSFACSVNRLESDLRSAVGPAVSSIDNALLDRETGSVAEIINPQELRLDYDWKKECYCFTSYGNHTVIRVRENIYKQMFNTPYKPVNKQNTFPVPPVGWMTWYAVQFNACEKAVLDNAAWVKENLAPFGATTIWVDWEWYHSAFEIHGPEGIDYFHPDPVRYPNGLAYVAEKIKEMGLIPALWIGPTNEPAKNEFIVKNEDALLAKKVAWCGEYFFDLSSEKYLNEYLPAAINKVKEWGYEALKWDCLPVTLLYADQFHEYMQKSDLTSEQALREVVKRARNIVGKDFYMLSCAGAADREILFAIDIFDGARIGGDIFGWNEFINDFVERVMRFYSYHNIETYCDPDNLVIRPEHNTFDQAVSRVSFLSVLGLPITLGDDLPKLPEERVELIKRCIPALDAHPMDIREVQRDGSTVIANLCVSKPFAQWNVVDVLNLNESESTIQINLQRNLHLEQGTYLVYDYWNKEFMGEFNDQITFTLRGCASKVFAIHKKTGVPQLISTSRHISQGAVEIKSIVWDEKEGCLKGVSELVKGDPYEIRAYDPSNGKLVTKTFNTDISGDMNWKIKF